MLLTLLEKKQETKDVFSFIFEPNEPFTWRPGQYLFYTLPNDNPDNRGVTRYFTISSAPFEGFVAITTRISKESSTFKKSLIDMNIGDTIEASGPDGDFVVDDAGRNLVFIAGGIGITPFRSILLQLNHERKPINVQLLYANRDKDTVFKDRLESLVEKNPNFKINYFISPHRIDEKALSTLNSQLSTLNFYISGPSPFVRSIRDLLKEQGALSKNIKLDFFPGYKE